MTHDERVYHHTYETLEGIKEHAERIASLEELATEMAVVIGVYDLTAALYDDERLPALPLFAERLEKLGIEVPSL